MILKGPHLKPFTIFLLFLFLNLVMLSFQFRSSSEEPFIKYWFFAGTTPVLAAINDSLTSLDQWWSSLLSFQEVIEENKRLKRELDELRFDQKILGDQLARNAVLEKMLHLLLAYEQEGLVSEVVARGASFWENGIMIRGGQDDGIFADFPVLGPQGIIGFTKRCSSSHSDVMIITNPGFAIAGRIQGTDVRGVIHGNGDPLLSFQYVTVSAHVSVNDLVVSSGEEGIFPANFNIGRVVKINKKGAVFQEILVTPSVDVSNLRFVFVLRKTGGAAQ